MFLLKGHQLGRGFLLADCILFRGDRAPEKRQIRSEDQAHGIQRGSGQQTERLAAGKAQADRQQRQPKMVTAGPEETAVIGRRVTHADRDRETRTEDNAAGNAVRVRPASGAITRP